MLRGKWGWLAHYIIKKLIKYGGSTYLIFIVRIWNLGVASMVSYLIGREHKNLDQNLENTFHK